MWPIVLTILNLPRKVRYSFSNLLLVGIVPGNGTKEPNTLDPYFDILVDELLSLSKRKLFDAYQNAPFELKLQVFMFVLDYRRIRKLCDHFIYAIMRIFAKSHNIMREKGAFREEFGITPKFTIFYQR